MLRNDTFFSIQRHFLHLHHHKHASWPTPKSRMLQAPRFYNTVDSVMYTYSLNESVTHTHFSLIYCHACVRSFALLFSQKVIIFSFCASFWARKTLPVNYRNNITMYTTSSCHFVCNLIPKTCNDGKKQEWNFYEIIKGSKLFSDNGLAKNIQ